MSEELLNDQVMSVDGTQTITHDGIGGVLYELAVRIDGGLSRALPALVGPAVNAVYAQALTAVLADRTLGGLVMDVREGIGEQALGLDVEINREPYTAASAGFGIHVTLPYWHSTGVPSQREAALEAIRAALVPSLPASRSQYGSG